VHAIAACAAVALFPAAFGPFGILAHAVRRRTQEIGIRIAVGGLPRDVLALVMRDALGVTLAGVLCGLTGALVLTRVMTSLLSGVSPADPRLPRDFVVASRRGGPGLLDPGQPSRQDRPGHRPQIRISNRFGSARRARAADGQIIGRQGQFAAWQERVNRT
jgi:ABC-type antimicrobial peptide transport system permease subunit